jgi:hypothetical protein
MHIIDQLRKELPAVFAGKQLDELTGHAIRWSTIQNKRSERLIPTDCFVRSGTRVLVVRDPFLSWWATTLSEAAPPGPDRTTPPACKAREYPSAIGEKNKRRMS